MPTFSFAANPPEMSGPTDLHTEGSELLAPCPKVGCGWKELLDTVNLSVKFALKLAVFIAAIMFCYAGFLMVTSGGSTEMATKARKIFTNVVIGLVFVAACWLIIELIATVLGYNGSWIGF